MKNMTRREMIKAKQSGDLTLDELIDEVMELRKRLHVAEGGLGILLEELLPLNETVLIKGYSHNIIFRIASYNHKTNEYKLKVPSFEIGSELPTLLFAREELLVVTIEEEDGCEVPEVPEVTQETKEHKTPFINENEDGTFEISGLKQLEIERLFKSGKFIKKGMKSL